MPKYKVKLISETTKVTFVEVEADNETEAVEEAYEYEEKDLEWEYTHTEYWADDVKELTEVKL